MLLAEPMKSMMTLAFSLALRSLTLSTFGAALWGKRKALLLFEIKTLWARQSNQQDTAHILFHIWNNSGKNAPVKLMIMCIYSKMEPRPTDLSLPKITIKNEGF